MGLLASAKKKVQQSVETKAKELYSKASPKVQQEIDKFVSSKAKDALKYVSYLLGAGIFVYIATRDGNEKKELYSDELRSISITYNDIHDTYNYYKGE